jgi:hypothetical protein
MPRSITKLLGIRSTRSLVRIERTGMEAGFFFTKDRPKRTPEVARAFLDDVARYKARGGKISYALSGMIALAELTAATPRPGSPKTRRRGRTIAPRA